MKRIIVVMIVMLVIISCKQKENKIVENFIYPECIKNKDIFEDRLKDKNLNDIIIALKKYEKENYSFILDNSYEFKSEDEPDYFKYIDREEIINKVEVFVNSWEKDNFMIKCWSKNNKDNKIIIFSSLEYNKDEIEF